MERGAPRETDKVRQHSPARVNERLDHTTATRIEDYATRTRLEISCRLFALDKEWSIERTLMLGTSLLGLPGLGFAGRSRLWLLLPAAGALGMLQFAVSGWGPGASLLRRLGLRTRREIDLERFALKALRGDFDAIAAAKSPIARAGNALQAAILC